MFLVTLFLRLVLSAQIFVSDSTCLICFEKPVMTLFRTCGHVCACETCAKQFHGKQCPVCRKEIYEIVSTETMTFGTDDTKHLRWCQAFYQQSVPEAYKYRPNQQDESILLLKKHFAKQRDRGEEIDPNYHLELFKHYLVIEATLTICKLDTRNRNIKNI